MLPKEELLKGSLDPKGMENLINQAESVLKTWQPSWSPFLPAQLREEALHRLGTLSELQLFSHGGYPGAERQRIHCSRRNQHSRQIPEKAQIEGLLIEGNFLFDPISPSDLRQALHNMGAAADGLGDIWIRGDRGGQAICSPELASEMNGCSGLVRDVEIRCVAISQEGLQLPTTRLHRLINSVEASCRLDAIASAGFGISRAKVVTQLKAGHLRLNWTEVSQASRELVVGDCLQLQNRGSLKVMSLELTKRQRWRVEMIRS